MAPDVPLIHGGRQVKPTGRIQWLIIHGRLLGKALAPLAAVTVALRMPLLVPQQPQPEGWRKRP